MTTSEQIRVLCVRSGVSLSELARRINQTPQNFNAKLKRNTITQDEMNRISPYDTENLVGYQKEYIAGFSSESNDASLDEGLIVAKDLMDSEIQRLALSRYRYDVVGSFDAQTSYTAIGFRYALMPIWIFECKHKEKSYRYIVNGRTGRSYGKYPLSVGKIMAVVLAVLAVVATFVFIYLSNSGLIQI